MTTMQRVLIVDDKEDNLYYLRTLLAAYGYDVESAAHGAEALAKARHSPPNLVIADLLMPVMDGYEFLRSLRQLPDGDRPKVVFCTTENDVAHIARALHAGANEYIMKPFDKDIVTAKFQEVGLI